MFRLSKRQNMCALLLAVVALGMSRSGAQADTILFNPTGGVTTQGGFNPGTFSVSSLDWGAGDALGVAALVNGPLTPGSTFQLYGQLRLLGLNLSGGGGPVTPPGLNLANGYQITEVFSLTEHVDSVVNNNATFSLNPVQNAPSGEKIYFQDLVMGGGTPANFNSGTGFTAATVANRGSLIYSASFASDQSNYTDTTKVNPIASPIVPLNPTGTNFVGITTDQGTGMLSHNTSKNAVGGNVPFSLDPTFFITPGILGSIFTSTLGNPFGQIPASIKFNDPTAPLGAGATGPTPAVGANNGTSGPDILFQISGTGGAAESFGTSTVPEPASISMALTALGFVLLAARRVQRRRAQAY
jgi:MYXO-CTERM domain-containing protein